MEMNMQITLVFDNDDLEEMIRLYLLNHPEKLGSLSKYRLEVDIDRQRGELEAVIIPLPEKHEPIAKHTSRSPKKKSAKGVR